MVSTSAKLAVKCHALRAATWLDLWADHLLGELEKEAVELYPRHGGLPEGSTERDLITITFERRDVEDLIQGALHVMSRQGRGDPRLLRCLCAVERNN
jgi:hypothetical protein